MGFNPNRFTVYANPGPSYALDYVQSVNVAFGRTIWSEALSPMTATVTLLYPDGWTTPNPDLVYGGQITIYWQPDGAVPSVTLLDGLITDISVRYGIPWTGTQGWADEITLTVGGYLSEINNRTVSLQTGTKTLSTYATRFGLQGMTFTMDADVSGLGGSVTPATQDVASFVDALRYTYALEVTESTYALIASRAQFKLPESFSDTTSDSTHQRFESVEVESLAQEYASSVTMTPQVPAAQTFDAGTTPVVEASFNTISATTGQALSAAQYYGDSMSVMSMNFSSITVRSEAQSVDNAGFGWNAVGAVVDIAMRGETIAAKIIGGSLSATPSTGLWTYYLTSPYNGNFLVLDDSYFGVLDSNRLGF